MLCETRCAPVARKSSQTSLYSPWSAKEALSRHYMNNDRQAKQSIITVAQNVCKFSSGCPPQSVHAVICGDHDENFATDCIIVTTHCFACRLAAVRCRSSCKFVDWGPALTIFLFLCRIIDSIYRHHCSPGPGQYYPYILCNLVHLVNLRFRYRGQGKFGQILA